MKIRKQYFGNRFASASKNKAKKSVGASQGVNEMESLESRVLLSGIGTGIKQKSVSFFDADGDLVKVTAQGKNASFDISLAGLATDNANIDQININGAGASLAVVVSPVGSFSKPVETFSNRSVYNLTPGFTTIGQITTSETSLGSIGLSAANVADINLGSATVQNISVGIGQVARVDALTGHNGLDNINVHNIEAGKINGGISLNGDVSGANNFLGNITVTNGIGRITGLNSDFSGSIEIAGANATLGTIALQPGDSQSYNIHTTGDLTFNAANFYGALQVDGHLNLTIQGGDFGGSIVAGKGISGLRASTLDPILVSNGGIDGSIVSAGAISDITLTTSAVINGGSIEGDSLGTITSNQSLTWSSASIVSHHDMGGIVLRGAGLDNSVSLSVAGTLNKIDIANGSLTGVVHAGQINSIQVTNGSIYNADISAIGTIGDISVTSLNSDAISSTNIVGSSVGNITAISAGDSHNWGGTGISSVTVVATDSTKAGTGVGAITGTGITGGIESLTVISAKGIGAVNGSALIDGVGIDYSSFTAKDGGITSVTGSSNGTTADFWNGYDNGLSNVTIAASGNIGAVTGSAFSANGIDWVTVRSTGGDIGQVTGTSSDILGSCDGINHVEVTSNTGIVTGISGSAAGFGNGLNSGVQVYAQNGIDTISGSSFSGTGIHDGTYQVVNGKIGAINASVNAATTGTGNAIDGSGFYAINGDIGAITATTSGQGSSGIYDATFRANNIGNVTVNATNVYAGNAIDGGTTFTATTGNIGNFSATTNGSGSNAIYTDGYPPVITAAGNLGDFSAKVTSTTGGSAFVGSGFDVNVTGTVASVTISDASTYSSVYGLDGASFHTGDILGAVTITTTGDAQISYGGFNSGSIGSVDLRVATGGTAVDSMVGSTIISSGNIGAIQIDGNVTGNNVQWAYSSIIAQGSIASVNIGGSLVGDGWGTRGSEVLANTGIVGAVSITGDVDHLSVVTAGTSNHAFGGNIASVNIGGNLDGTIAAYNSNVVGDTHGNILGAVTVGKGLSGTVQADGTIGVVTVNADGLTGTGSIQAGGALDSLVVKAGGVSGSVTAGSITNGLNITGNYTGTVITNTGGIGGAITTTGILHGSITSAGAIGTVTADGGFIGGATLVAGTNIGDITSKAAGNQSLNLTASATGTIGNITFGSLANGEVASVNVNTASSVGNISTSGDLTVTGSSSSVGNVSITAAGAHAISLTTGAVGNIALNSLAIGDLGTVTTTAATLGNLSTSGDLTLHGASLTTVGNVDVTGTGAHAIDLTTGATGHIGSVTFGTGVTGSVNIWSATNVGDISSTGNLTLDSDSLTTVGNVTVTGAVFGLGSATALSNVTSFGNLSVGSLAATTSATTIGAGHAGSIGTIAIGADYTPGVGQQAYTFSFGTYAADPVAVVTGNNIVTNPLDAATAAGVGGAATTGGGIIFTKI